MGNNRASSGNLSPWHFQSLGSPHPVPFVPCCPTLFHGSCCHFLRCLCLKRKEKQVWCQGGSQGLFVFTRSKGACDPQTHCSGWFPKPQIKLGFCVSPSHTSFGVQGVAPVLPEQWLCTSPCSPKTSSLELKNVCVLYS